MTNNEEKENNTPQNVEEEGVELAKTIAEESEFGSRKVSGGEKLLISIVAAAWSLFQLSLPKLIMLSAVYIRAIHLAFAITLVYLSYPAFKKVRTKGILSFLSRKQGISVFDWILAGVAALAALYLAIDYVGLSGRQGTALPRDIWIGIILIILLLEAARRSIGPALSVVALMFTLYSFFGPYMPDIIAFKGVSLGRYMAQITMSTEGIYGVPLDVSATVVFLFVLFGAMLEKAGGGKYFVQLAISLIGRYKGGPAKAAVLASGLTGLISGSSIANTVTTGTFTIPLMKRMGYPATKAAAVEVAASTNGQLMPPIMGAAAFIIAEYCNITYFEVVRAAFVPAVISYCALIYITHLEASKLGLRGIPKEELPKFFPLLIKGIYYFIPLFFLVYELMIVRRSPELSAFYAILVLAILMVIKNIAEIHFKKESVKNIRWVAVLRDIVILWGLLFIGGFIVGLISESLLILVVISLAFSIVGFTISGCLVKIERVRHLVLVAVGGWLVWWLVAVGGWFVGAISSVFEIEIGYWLGSSIIFLSGMVIGGELSSLIVKAPKPQEETYGIRRGVLQIWESLVAGGRNMMGIGVAVASAGIIVGVVTMGLGARITDIIDQIAGGNLILLLIITAIASLILGMGLPTTANYVVMASLTAPAIVWLGADYGLEVPLIAAHLFVFFFGILADDTPPVGLAAFAASAIAKSPPIPTGIQGFMYDIRTALLPFMFLFNTDLLLIGVHRWWHIILIFLTGVLAMFAFANLTQNFFIAKNRVHESLLLILVIALLFRPYYFMEKLPFLGTQLGKFESYIVGLIIYGIVYFLQRPRAKRQIAAATA